MAPPARIPLIACGMLTLTVVSCMKARPTVLAPQTISLASAPVAALTPAEKAADRADMAQRMKRSESGIRDSSDFAGREERSEPAVREHFSNPSGLALLNSEEAHPLFTGSYNPDLRMSPGTVIRPVAAEHISAAKVVELLAEASAKGKAAKAATTTSIVNDGSGVVAANAQEITPISSSEGEVVNELRPSELNADAQTKAVEPVKAASERPARTRATRRKTGGTVKAGSRSDRSQAVAGVR